MIRHRVTAPFVLLLVAACGTEEPPSNGVNDVKAACEIRATWTRKTAAQCVSCEVTSVLKRCECEAFRDYSGACVTQAEARQAEPSCTTALDECLGRCDALDCVCQEHCYDGAQACKRASAARDGCVAEVCTRFCREPA